MATSFCHSNKRISLFERKVGSAKMKQRCSQSKMSKVLLTSVFLYNFLLVAQWISRSVGSVRYCQPTYLLSAAKHTLGKNINICVFSYLSIFLKYIWIQRLDLVSTLIIHHITVESIPQ